MKKFLVQRNGNWVLERRTRPPKEEHIEVDGESNCADCYKIYVDPDGTKVAFISERKYADELNQLAREKYELSKQK